jgi:hypothetical protein
MSATTEDIDIYRSAKLMIQQHGDEAPIFAAELAGFTHLPDGKIFAPCSSSTRTQRQVSVQFPLGRTTNLWLTVGRQRQWDKLAGLHKEKALQTIGSEELLVWFPNQKKTGQRHNRLLQCDSI